MAPDDCAGNPRRENQRQDQCPPRQAAPSPIDSVGMLAAQRLHARREYAGTLCQMKAAEIFDLRAGDQHRDPVGEADDDGTGNIFHRRSHAGHTQDINRTPAIMVQRKRPSTPWTAMMPATTTTKAPVGPPIWCLDPPIAEIRNPVTTAQ